MELSGIITKENTKETHNTHINDTILVCPKCLNKIPLLSWVILNKKVQIEINCKDCFNSTMDFDYYLSKIQKETLHYCTRNHNHQSIAADKYCIECQKWVCNQCIRSHEVLVDLNGIL